MFVLILLVLSAINLNVKCDDGFHEHLLLKRLNNAHIYSYFQFTFSGNNLTYEYFKHSHLFPLTLGQIIERYNVQELRISLTEGFWRYKQWGYPVVEASPGAEVLVWFKEDTTEVDRVWKDLVNALSGLLCASLNFISDVNTMAPNLSFRLEGIDKTNRNSSFIRYSTLPREIVCTENLTPWKKLLPCQKNGLITLLNARQIHNTDYHSLGIHFKSACRSGTACSYVDMQLKLTVSLVFDLMLLDGNQKDWSVRKLFGNVVIGVCPVASTTNIYLDITANNTDLTFYTSKDPTNVQHLRDGNDDRIITSYAVYNISENLDTKFNLEVYYDIPSLPVNDVPPILYVNRYIAGYGHEYGRIVTEISNNHAHPITAIYLENIPWFLPVYYQSLKITNRNKRIIPTKTFYRPGKSRVRPYYLEVLLDLPGNSITEISIEFEYVFLKWQEYPPDANHGFYIGSAVVTAFLPTSRNLTTALLKDTEIFNNYEHDGAFSNATKNSNCNIVQLRTESLIITLPTPDFSMPYNVICLACTVVALAFGPIHNITTKSLMFKNAKKKRGLRKLVDNVIQYFKRKLSRTVQSSTAS